MSCEVDLHHGGFTKGKSQGQIEVTNPTLEEVLDRVQGASTNPERPGTPIGISTWRTGNIGIRMGGNLSLRVTIRERISPIVVVEIASSSLRSFLQ